MIIYAFIFFFKQHRNFLKAIYYGLNLNALKAKKKKRDNVDALISK